MKTKTARNTWVQIAIKVLGRSQSPGPSQTGQLVIKILLNIPQKGKGAGQVCIRGPQEGRKHGEGGQSVVRVGGAVKGKELSKYATQKRAAGPRKTKSKNEMNTLEKS